MSAPLLPGAGFQSCEKMSLSNVPCLAVAVVDDVMDGYNKSVAGTIQI